MHRCSIGKKWRERALLLVFSVQRGEADYTNRERSEKREENREERREERSESYGMNGLEEEE